MKFSSSVFAVLLLCIKACDEILSNQEELLLMAPNHFLTLDRNSYNRVRRSRLHRIHEALGGKEFILSPGDTFTIDPSNLELGDDFVLTLSFDGEVETGAQEIAYSCKRSPYDKLSSFFRICNKAEGYFNSIRFRKATTISHDDNHPKYKFQHTFGEGDTPITLCHRTTNRKTVYIQESSGAIRGFEIPSKQEPKTLSLRVDPHLLSPIVEEKQVQHDDETNATENLNEASDNSIEEHEYIPVCDEQTLKRIQQVLGEIISFPIDGEIVIDPRFFESGDQFILQVEKEGSVGQDAQRIHYNVKTSRYSSLRGYKNVSNMVEGKYQRFKFIIGEETKHEEHCDDFSFVHEFSGKYDEPVRMIHRLMDEETIYVTHSPSSTIHGFPVKRFSEPKELNFRVTS